jgi:hypothetical protein
VESDDDGDGSDDDDDDSNKIADGVFHDAVHGLDQSVLYLRNIVCFHGTQVNVLSFTPTTEARPSSR